MFDQIPTAIFVAAGAIVASAFSALLAFVSLIVSKEQSVSSFRQNWIDALRDDLALFLTSATNISVHAQLVDEKLESGSAKSDIVSSMTADISTAYVSYHKIMLRLNPSEHDQLIELINQLERNLSNRKFLSDTNLFGNLCDDIDRESHAILKNEWKRVKSGEFTFRIVKYSSIVLVLIGLLAAIISLTGYVQKS